MVMDKKSRKFSINKIDEVKEGLVGVIFILFKCIIVVVDY